MQKMKLMLSSLLVLLTLTPQFNTVFASEAVANLRVDIANGQAIFNEGKGSAMACSGCHGEKGLGMDAMESARLANIGEIYVVKQLYDYASGKRTDPGGGAMMNDIAKALSEQDRLDVAAYADSFEYSTEPSDLKALAQEGSNVGDPKKGKIIMIEGIKPQVPACQDCHGLSGRAQNIPAIHQQKYVYLVNQLKRYRDGSRANDLKVYKYGIMRGIANKLSDDNIADIAAYLATIKEMTP